MSRRPPSCFWIQTAAAAVWILAATGVLEAKPTPPSFELEAQPVDRVALEVMPALDNRELIAKAESEAAARGKTLRGAPYRFAERIPVALAAVSSGTWETLADGSRLWRLRLRSPGALSLNLHFERFELPLGARLWLYNPAGDHVQGPYSTASRNVHDELWTAPVLGEEAVIELHLPAGAAKPRLELAAVNHGFRGLPRKQHGSCNNDVVCPEGDPWRDQIRGTVFLLYDGRLFCTGQLVNNTAVDRRPYVLSAFHCITDVFDVPDFDLVPTAVIFFNHEAPVCGQQSGSNFTQSLSGATFVAGDVITDFILIEMDQTPPAAFDPHYVGWNVSGQNPSAAVGIHHPAGDVKSISFDDDPVTTDVEFFINPPGTHWRIGGWEDGTTEGGSSGSCIYDPQDGLCVGVLTGGFAACPEDDPDRPEDYYGKLSAAWNAGPTPENRLRDWLDPLGLGVISWPGMDPVSSSICTPSDTVMCLLNGRFQVELEWATRTMSADAEVVPLGSANSGMFYFTNPANWEMLIKVLNNCDGPTNRYWVFAAATTTLEYTLKVTDTSTGDVRIYGNPFGVSSPAITDTNAFDTCP